MNAKMREVGKRLRILYSKNLDKSKNGYPHCVTQIAIPDRTEPATIRLLFYWHFRIVKLARLNDMLSTLSVSATELKACRLASPPVQPSSCRLHKRTMAPRPASKLHGAQDKQSTNGELSSPTLSSVA